MTKLQRNTLRSLTGNLGDFADFESQRRYKKAVPFVHVPLELASEWENYPRLLDEGREWFLDVLSQDQIAAIRSFDGVISSVDMRSDFPDVEEVFRLEDWIAVSMGAKAALESFPNRTSEQGVDLNT